MAARTLSQLQQRYNSTSSQKNGKGPMRVGPSRGGRAGMHAGGKPKDTRRTIGRLISYMTAYKGFLLLALLCMLVSTGLSLACSYLLRPIINGIADTTLSASARLKGLAAGAVLLLAAYALSAGVSYLQNRVMLHISQSAIERLRNDLFCKLQALPVSFFDRENTGEIMSRFTNDVDNVGTMLDNSVISLFSGAITLVGTLVMMLYTNVWLTVITLVFAPLFALSGMKIATFSRKYYSAQQASLGALNGYIEENVTGQKVVKVFGREGICQEEFSLLNRDLAKKQVGAQFFGGIMGPIMGNLSQVSYALTAGIGGLLCVLRGFDVGGLTIFVNYSRHFSQPINTLSQQMTAVFSALAGAERVFDIMDRTPEDPDAADAACTPISGEVTFSDVSFGYLPEKIVHKKISLTAHPGQKIAFVGSTGAGKTTVTNLLSRFYDISSGQILIDGRDIKRYPRAFLRSNIAMVLQDTHLFTGTVRENIRYGRPDATDEEVEAAARVASAHSFIMRLSDGYDTLLTGDGLNLSQGQRQLLNIARAAISRAPILVLDEATSSVDTRTERHIEHGMDRLMQNRTTFVIAHRLSTVRNADAIMVLENGEIIERGSHDDLLAQKGRYYELYTGMKELD